MLEKLLKDFFNCEELYLRKPKLLYEESDGFKQYEYLTKDGVRAYEELVSILYKLNEMDVLDNVDEVVENLDNILLERF